MTQGYTSLSPPQTDNASALLSTTIAPSASSTDLETKASPYAAPAPRGTCPSETAKDWLGDSWEKGAA